MISGDRPPQSSVCPRWVFVLTVLLFVGLVLTTANLRYRLARQQREDSREHAFWVVCQPGYSAEARKSAFLLLVAQGNKEWRSASLADLNLEKSGLAAAQLEGAAFGRVKLAAVSLSGANLKKSSFEMADLTGADLSKADLSEAQLYRTVLKKANLKLAILRGANLQEVKAVGAQFLAADLGDSDCLMADFSGASLAGANLTGARLELAKFSGANLSLARLQDANIKDADFSSCNWWRARGLTSVQAELLKKQFAPDTNAPAELKRDFEDWQRVAGR